MWVKICANTSLEDAQQAIDLGADAVGFVFAPSRRQVTPEAVAAITVQLQGTAERIGIFPDLRSEAIQDAVHLAGLTGVQLHGAFRPELIESLRTAFGPAITITQTLHWEAGSTGMPAGREPAAMLLDQLTLLKRPNLVDRVLVDSKVGDELGGTGVPFDWQRATGFFSPKNGLRMIAAGGLSPENVAEAIERLRPWGVDVASGVERSPGRKDPERVKRFIEGARSAWKHTVV